MADTAAPERPDVEGIERILSRHRAIGSSLVVPLIAYIRHLEGEREQARIEGRREALEAAAKECRFGPLVSPDGLNEGISAAAGIILNIDPATLQPKEPTT